jgi:hypothetical protein
VLDPGSIFKETGREAAGGAKRKGSVGMKADNRGTEQVRALGGCDPAENVPSMTFGSLQARNEEMRGTHGSNKEQTHTGFLGSILTSIKKLFGGSR